MGSQRKIKKGVLPLPEVVASFRRDWIDDEKWNVKVIADPANSKSNIITHEMEVSSLTDDVSRFYRQRELVRTRISFANAEQVSSVKRFKDVDTNLLMAAEEFRINSVARKLGFNPDLIKDGSEKQMGERFAKDGSASGWNQAIAYGLGLAGTKAFNSFLTGVRGTKPEWANKLREMHNAIAPYFKEKGVSRLASTQPMSHHFETGKDEWDTVVMPQGFEYSLTVARHAGRYLVDEDAPEGNTPGEGFKTEGFETSTTDSDKFAPLIIDRSVPLNVMVKGYLHRKKVSAPTGKRILYPDRLLTDPHRRVFGSKIKVNGGVVLIDTSGSMHLSETDVEAILTAAPGALIMAYSHAPGSSSKPNLFILADRGKRVKNVSDVPYQNGGNGVDGPALEYAIKKRKKSEPLVWICDGHVTGSHDNGNDGLAMQCAKLVIKHKIVMIPDVQHAVEAFKSNKLISQPDGSVKRAIIELKRRKRM